MSAVRVAPPDADLVRTLRRIDDTVRSASGHEAFPEAVWRACTETPESVRVAVDDGGGAAAVAMMTDSFRPPVRQVALGAVPGTEPVSVASLLTAIDSADAPMDELWLPGTDPVVFDAALAAGFAEDRRLFQMRVALPVAAPRFPDSVTVRPFAPGRDEDAWLAVNNRAFANHPDQGGWVRSRLVRRMEEPWFDPAGFLLAEQDGALVGFCWTKVHHTPEVLGEIFVIGVDPSAHGRGLGRALVLAGLDHLHRVRGCDTGVLYVAAGNPTAVGLYESIGFRVVRTDTALRREAR
jgi:mycothiol synthase